MSPLEDQTVEQDSLRYRDLAQHRRNPAESTTPFAVRAASPVGGRNLMAPSCDVSVPPSAPRLASMSGALECDAVSEAAVRGLMRSGSSGMAAARFLSSSRL